MANLPRFKAHNVFDTGHISHPVGWSHQPLDDWTAYVKEEFTRADEWRNKLDAHGGADKGRNILGGDHRKLVKNFKTDRVEVFDKDLHLTVPRFYGHQPARGPDEAMVSTGAIGAHNWSATMRDKSAIAGRGGSHTRAAAALKGYTSSQLRTMRGRELRTAARANQTEAPRKGARSCTIPVAARTVHSTDHRLYPSRYTRKNGTMLWRDFVKTEGRRPMMTCCTTAMQQQQEYAAVQSTASKVGSNVNLSRLAAWPFVKLRKWLSKNGFSKDDLSKCPGKEELLELWRLKQEFESQPKHRSAGDFRAGLERQARVIEPGFDHTNTSPVTALHVHGGDYRSGETRSEAGGANRGDNTKVERFHFGHEAGGSTAVQFQGPAFLREEE